MRISVVTLLPDLFVPFLNTSIIDKSQQEEKLTVDLVDLREFGIGSHKQVDDRPYGGGVGMILRVDVISRALDSIKSTNHLKRILLTPQGKVLNQKRAQRLAEEKELILICGRYEGVDERVRDLVDEELSIGDYVLSGGEVPAMVVMGAIARLIPGVLEEEATAKESFSPWEVGRESVKTLLEPPQYTRPKEFAGRKVPSILLSGDHENIKKWRLKKALQKTKRRRPDLLREGS
jgi:tRNA (guanine37-N1)-methyltransferase